MNHEADLKAKVHELFQKAADRLDSDLNRLISSGCGIVDDHAKHGDYLVAKAFLCAFLQDEQDRYTPSLINKTFDDLLNNYEKFI